MAKRGKQYLKIIESKVIDKSKRYTLDEAIQLMQKTHFVKFDETVDMAVNLGVNPKHADQIVRGSCVLPHGLGKSMKVLVFAKGDKEKEALDAGADFIGSDEIIEKIKQGWFAFDKVVATPDMMGSVGKLAKILGPKGLMPNVKLGTITFELANVIKEIKTGRVDFRVEKAGIVHAPVGKVSFEFNKLKENITAFIELIMKLKPSSAKGTYLKGICLSSTHGPGVKLDVNEFTRART